MGDTNNAQGDFIYEEKKKLSLAPNCNPLMTAHAYRIGGIKCAREVCRKQVRYKPLLPDRKAPMLLSLYFNLWQADFCVGIHFTKKIDDIIRRYPLSGKESWEWLDTRPHGRLMNWIFSITKTLIHTLLQLGYPRLMQHSCGIVNLRKRLSLAVSVRSTSTHNVQNKH